VVVLVVVVMVTMMIMALVRQWFGPWWSSQIYGYYPDTENFEGNGDLPG